MFFRGKFPDHIGQPHFRYTEPAEVRRLQTMLQRIQADDKERAALEQEIKTQQQAARKDAVAPVNSAKTAEESKNIPTINDRYELQLYQFIRNNETSDIKAKRCYTLMSVSKNFFTL